MKLTVKRRDRAVPGADGAESAGTRSAVLEAVDVSAGYSAIPVIRELNLRVEPGEVVALLGPNGAGKTTTLLTLAGEVTPLSGKVRFRGAETSVSLHRRCSNGLSFVTEERSIFPSLSTEDNLRLGSGGVKGAVALMPELQKLLKRKAGLLSGGEQQMLTLARALARDPVVLLADELSLGLAPLVVRRLLAALRASADRGLGVLLVEQRIGEALAVADRAYVLQRGKVIMTGTAGEIRERYAEVEASYLSQSNSESRYHAQPR